MTFIIIGNIIALIASLLMVYSGIVKEKKQVLFYQTLEVGFAVISYLFLGGIAGAVVNTTNLIRNYLCYKDRLTTLAKIVISILAVILVLYFNKEGIIGLLPLVCIIVYLWLITINDIVKFKIMIMSLMVLWTIYDFLVLNYVAAVFDILTIIANIISIKNIRKESKK